MPKSNVPGHAGRVKHSDDCDGCWECCTKCSYAKHLCPGCGAAIKHGTSGCVDCNTAGQSGAYR